MMLLLNAHDYDDIDIYLYPIHPSMEHGTETKKPASLSLYEVSVYMYMCVL